MERKRRMGLFACSILAAAASRSEAANTIYWTGSAGTALDFVNSGVSNWATAQTAGVDYGQAPQAGDNIVFSADGSASANVAATSLSPVAPATSVTTSFYGSMTVMGNQPAITLSGDNSHFLNMGNITVANGAGPLTINTRMLVSTDAKWEVDNASTLTFGVVVTGANTPNLTLAGNGTFATASTVSGLFVHVNSGATWRPAGAISGDVTSLDGGAFDGRNASSVLGWVVGTGGTFQNFGAGVGSNGTLDIDFGSLLTSGTYAGSIGNAIVDLNVRSVNTTGTWTLTGSSSYTGKTQIDTVTSGHGATVILSGADNRLPVGSSLVMGAGFVTTAVTSKLQLGDGSGPVNQTFAGLTSAAATAMNIVSIVGGNSAISRLTSNNPGTTTTFNGTLGGTLPNENNLALTKSGTGILNLSGTESYVGDTTVSGGTLNMAAGGLWTNSTSFSVNALTGNAFLVLNQANALPATATITGTSSSTFVPSVIVNTSQTFASLTSSGSTSFTSGTSTVGPINGTGTLTVGTGVNLSATYVRQGTLSIGSGATVTIGSNTTIGAAVSNVGKLTLNATGTLDLNNNDLIVNHASGDTTTLASVKASILQSYDAGAWDKPGITSTLLKTRPNYGLGYGEATALGITTFDGQPVTNAVVVKYALLGDANLDNVVNGLDFNALATNFGPSTQGWIGGDFNYDGTVNTSDFVALAGNFNSTTLAAPVLSTLVPEPVALGVAALSLVVLSQRRRRA